ncbi:MAG: histidine triad nucleotide-binding protein [Candidatus Eiseniibacteriota bacterium]|jgi:histidine triad (HIT) family protein
MSRDCIFCRIAGGEVPSSRVHEDASVVAFDDLNPQAPVHVLVVPREHIATLNDLEAGHEALAGHMVLVARQIAAARGLAEPGYRLVWNCQEGAGQSVFHLHLHLLGGRRMRWPPG